MLHIKKEILKLVKNISKVKPSGEEFFDILDSEFLSMNNEHIVKYALSKIPKNYTLVLSGKFGNHIASKIDAGTYSNYPYVLFAGGIRTGNKPTFICSKNTKWNSKTVFFDDSIYSGGTFRKIKEYIKNEMPQIQYPEVCFGIYDGSNTVNSDYTSLFRYFDFFPNEI